MDRVKGKVAIVTGAGSGIGKATAMLLAKEGAAVVVSEINESAGSKTAEEIRREGGQALFIKTDVTSESDWSKTIQKTVSEYGKLDILANIAGTMILGSIESMSLEAWRKQMAINLDSVFLGIKYAIGAMKSNRGGTIINMSSATGIVGTEKDGAAYCASKGAVRLLTKAAALECSKTGYDYNIRVNSIHPGGVNTPLTQSMWEQDERIKDRGASIHPIGRDGEPIDIAYAVLYLASDESSFMTGSELVIDGGWTAR